MFDHNAAPNKSIALIVWNTEKKEDVHVYTGGIVNQGDQYYFVNEENRGV